MVHILRTTLDVSPIEFSRKIIELNADKISGQGTDHGYYSESSIYHTLGVPLYGITQGGVHFKIREVTHFGSSLPGFGQVVVQFRAAGPSINPDKKVKPSEDETNTSYTRTIPRSSISQGPLYIPETNITVYLEHHKEMAYHPADPISVSRLIDAETAVRLNSTIHSGYIVTVRDRWSRISNIYTQVQGRVVSIPVDHSQPTKRELSSGKMLSIYNPEQGLVKLNPYDMICVNYCLDSTVGASSRDAILAHGASISELMDKSHNLWQVGGVWYSSNRDVLEDHLLALERAGESREPINTKLIDEAIARAVHERDRIINTMSIQTETLSAQLKASKSTIAELEKFTTEMLDAHKEDIESGVGGDAVEKIKKKRDLEHKKLEIEERKLSSAEAKLKEDSKTDWHKTIQNNISTIATIAKAAPAIITGVCLIIRVVGKLSETKG